MLLCVWKLIDKFRSLMYDCSLREEKRASKIRIVERLAQTAGTGLLPAAGGPPTLDSLDSFSLNAGIDPPLSRDGGTGAGEADFVAEGMLDDSALTALADTELEELLDKLIVRVMSQMVQVSMLKTMHTSVS